MASRPTLRAALLAAALLAPHAATADAGPASTYAKLISCAWGFHATCSAPPAILAALDPDRSFVLTCHEPIGAGWFERVPIAGSLDEADPWLAYGATRYVPIEAWTESPGAPVVEHIGAFLEVLAEGGFVLALEAGWGPAHGALKVDLQLDREGRTTARIRLTLPRDESEPTRERSTALLHQLCPTYRKLDGHHHNLRLQTTTTRDTSPSSMAARRRLAP